MKKYLVIALDNRKGSHSQPNCASLGDATMGGRRGLVLAACHVAYTLLREG